MSGGTQPLPNLMLCGYAYSFTLEPKYLNTGHSLKISVLSRMRFIYITLNNKFCAEWKVYIPVTHISSSSELLLSLWLHLIFVKNLLFNLLIVQANTPRLRKEQSYTSTPLWAFMACSRVNFTLQANTHTYIHRRDSAVGRAGRSGDQISVEKRFSQPSRPGPKPTQPPVHEVPDLSRVQSGREVVLTTHPLLAPKLRMGWSYTSHSPLCLSRHVMGGLYLYLPHTCIMRFVHDGECDGRTQNMISSSYLFPFQEGKQARNCIPHREHLACPLQTRTG